MSDYQFPQEPEWVMFKSPSCPYCDKAAGMLVGEDLHVVDISEDDDARAWFVSQGFRTVPQVFHGGELIGGSDKLEPYVVGLRAVQGM